jgi:urease subunit alpha
MPFGMSREEYARRYGPTTGDRVRLADSDLWVEIEDDHVGYGDEPLWGYGKNIRSRMTQSDRTTAESELDVLIAGVTLLDPYVGVVKTNIGIKDGRIVGIGRAGNPDITASVDMTIGANTMPIMGYGLIATAGAIDSHVHLITPNLVPVALSAGITTLITAGFEEPPMAMGITMQAFEQMPVNVGLQASARTDAPGAVERVVEAGAIGLKIHEDWGAYPEVIDATLRVADAHDIAVCLHTDSLNESAELDETVAAIGGRAVHAYHVEGTGGGHIPDVLALVAEDNVVCSSTTPTIPFGTAAADESVDMILAVHGGNPTVESDVESATERVRTTTMAAEGPLQEMGAISIVNSDSQGMGRIGETVRRTFQLAHLMKAWRNSEVGAGFPGAPPVARSSTRRQQAMDRADNERVLRYLAKVTAEPAIVHGISSEVGALLPGRLADVVLWSPAGFGVKPVLVLKAGHFAWGPLGEGNASVEAAEPVVFGPHWAAMGSAPAAVGLTFVSQAAIKSGLRERLGSKRRFVAVSGTRGVRRSSLVANTAVANIQIDPGDGTVRMGGRLVTSPPADEVPLSSRYFLS